MPILIIQSPKIIDELPPELNVKEMFYIIAHLLSNRVYLCLVFGTIFHIIAFLPYFAYLAKYLEYGFLMVTSQATMTAGAIMSAASVISVLISGLIDRRWSMSVRQMCLYNASMVACSVVTIPFFFIFSCPTGHIVGLNDPQPPHSCLPQGCNCTAYYRPVCVDGATYFSPCHAGCTQFFSDNSSYFGCLCGNATFAVRGQCFDMCPEVKAFLALVFFFLLFNGMSSVQFTKVLMRQATPATKPVALGCISVVFLIMGMVLPPIVGRLIDVACLVKQPGAGNCLHYNGPLLGKMVNVLGISAIGPAFVCQALAWYVAPKEDEDDRKWKEEEEKEWTVS